MRKARQHGFTLIEAIVVVAIAAVLAAMGVAMLGRMRPRATVSGAANELAAALSEAQARAMETGGYVWFITYPTTNGAPDAPVRARGGYIVYDDPDADFDLSAFAVDADGNFAPQEAADRVMDAVWYARASEGKVQLRRMLRNNVPVSIPLLAPFTGDSADCNYCGASPDGTRGALRFDAEGGLTRFTGDGTLYTAGTAAILSLSSDDTQAALAVAPQTGLVRVTKQ